MDVMYFNGVFMFLMQTITQFSHIFSELVYVLLCRGSCVTARCNIHTNFHSASPFHFLFANYLINCTSCSFSSVFVLSIPGLFFTLMEITSWNSLLSNVWLRLAGLVFLSVFFFSSWPSCHLLLLSDIILGSEPCAKSSDELEIGSGPCLVTLSLTSETQSSKHAPVFPHFLSLVMMGEQKKCLWSQGDNEGSGPK